MISDLKRKGSKSTTMAAPQESENPTNKNTIEFVSPFNDNTIESVTTGKDAIFLDDNRKTRQETIHLTTKGIQTNLTISAAETTITHLEYNSMRSLAPIQNYHPNTIERKILALASR
jgi:hypothetical protein